MSASGRALQGQRVERDPLALRLPREPQGGDRWSHRTEAHAEAINKVLERQADITLCELTAVLGVTRPGVAAVTSRAIRGGP